MKKIIIALALATLALSPAHADPAQRRQERPERTQRADRAPNPYSNAEQARRRRIREVVREVTEPRTGTYRFKALGKKKPDED